MNDTQCHHAWFKRNLRVYQVSGKTSTRRLGKAYSLIAYMEAKAYGSTDKARTVTGHV
jgi:hypothetical protein